MYIFIFTLIFVNFFLLYKYTFLTSFINLNDKKTKVPLLGGIFLYLNFLLIAFFYFYNPDILSLSIYFKDFFPDQKEISYREVIVFFLIPTLFFIMGLYDDKFNLTANYRIILSFFLIIVFLLINENFIIRSLIINRDIEIQLYSLSIIFTTICVIGLIFSLNMYDGINLQFGMYLLIIFTYFIFAGILKNFFLILIFLILIFLYLNFKNKMYMGDSGVYFIGVLISFVYLKNYNKGNLMIEEIIVLSSVPIFDMFRLIFLRIFNGSHPFRKDNRHLHHILKNRYKQKYLWHFGTYLTLLNIFFLKTLNNIYLIILLSVAIYLLTIIFLIFNARK